MLFAAGGVAASLRIGEVTLSIVCRTGSKSNPVAEWGHANSTSDDAHRPYDLHALIADPQGRTAETHDNSIGRGNSIIDAEFLSNAHRKAGTIEGGRFQISELKRELKELGLNPAEIARNLDYLVQNEWILRDTEPYVMTREGRTISSKRVTYRISSRGIDLFQGPSQFQRAGSPFSLSVIQNAPGIIQVGDVNYVNLQFRDLYLALDSLAQAILTSDKLSPWEQFERVADIRTLQAQLSKSVPDKNCGPGVVVLHRDDWQKWAPSPDSWSAWRA